MHFEVCILSIDSRVDGMLRLRMKMELCTVKLFTSTGKSTKDLLSKLRCEHHRSLNFSGEAKSICTVCHPFGVPIKFGLSLKWILIYLWKIFLKSGRTKKIDEKLIKFWQTIIHFVVISFTHLKSLIILTLKVYWWLVFTCAARIPPRNLNRRPTITKIIPDHPTSS